LEQLSRASIKEIRTPILEMTELFIRGIGEGTDVVSKEMYTFLDRGERSCTLRPEGTASVARALIQNGISSNPSKTLVHGSYVSIRKTSSRKAKTVSSVRC